MSAILSGVVRVVVETTGKGDAPAKVKATEKAIKDYEKAVGAAGKTTETFAEGIKPVNAFREGFEKLRANSMFLAGAIGTVVTVAASLWELLSGGSNPIPQFIVDTERAASAEYEFAKQLMQTVEASEKAAIKIDAVRVSTLRLAAANAAAVGDQKRQADLLRQAGIVEATATATDTQKSIDEMFARRRELNKAEQEAIAREKALRAQATSAFGLANLPGEADLETRGRAHIAATTASVAAELAAFEAQKARAESESLTKQIGAQNEALKAQRDAIAAAADRTIRLDEMLVTPKTSSGGSGEREAEKSRREMAEALRLDYEKRQRLAEADLGGRMFGAANDNALGISFGGGRSRADDIRDFTAALSDSLPVMGEFASMVSQLSETWTKWGEGSLTTRDAVVGSLGAIAKAGAQQIKDERLRAGVLSIIELGLGFANLANPAIAAGHFTASAILGSVALFSGGSGSSKGSGSGSSGGRTPAPRVGGGDALGGGNITYIINAPWFGPAPQESAAGVVSFIERPRGTGFERGRDAA